MKIHAIQTGMVALTSAWREGVGHGRRRLLHAIADRQWTEPCRSTPSRSSTRRA